MNFTNHNKMFLSTQLEWTIIKLGLLALVEIRPSPKMARNVPSRLLPYELVNLAPAHPLSGSNGIDP